ncbi:MAG: AbrB/MazE/SpoVT family DNA-binding domain-containing protein [Thermomicrobiales bacterium]|jgi:AbrB family looped-hinge helix DNA binding protein|nr:AbrB/MazE/SpoVT family DNA-binding domain-containing protein [Thermomicrobiales bacterium]
MSVRVELNKDGLIEIPVAVRERLAIETGDSMLLDVKDGAIVLVPIDLNPVEALRGLGRGLWGDEDAQDYVDRIRDER